jgi:CHASE3 domain sensor protein
MPMELLLALILVLPIVILFAVFIWYLNIGGIYAVIKESRQKRQALAESKKLETGRLQH